MNNNLEFENEDSSPDSIEDNHPRTNYGEGYYEEPKQETLEKAAESWLKSKTLLKTSQAPGLLIGFIEGAKWQQEAILDLLKVNGYEDDPIFDLITEQFKKK
jgi:hypothetical protein